MPNMPRPSATICTPSSRSGRPKVNRGVPVLMSDPTMLSSRPSVVMAMPLSGDPLESVEPAIRPRIMIEQMSAGPKPSATLVSTGAKKIISVMPNEAPMNEPMMATISAVPALPCLASG